MAAPFPSPSPAHPIFVEASLAAECFPHTVGLTFGYVLERLVEGCAEFRKRLEEGQRVEKVGQEGI